MFWQLYHRFSGGGTVSQSPPQKSGPRPFFGKPWGPLPAHFSVPWSPKIWSASLLGAGQILGPPNTGPRAFFLDVMGAPPTCSMPRGPKFLSACTWGVDLFLVRPNTGPRPSRAAGKFYPHCGNQLKGGHSGPLPQTVVCVPHISKRNR